jgi:16S rRNA (guanine527-N7)-methyltransferase
MVARHRLPPPAAEALVGLLEVLATDPGAPTAVRSPARAADTHLADSLVALDLGQVRRARVVLDVGAGAGFPGLALAAALPETTVRLVDSVAKKCAFMERAAARAGIGNADVVHARVEALGAEAQRVEPEGPETGRADVVTARAVGPLPLVLEYAAPILALDGHLVAWKGRREPDEEAEAARAAAELGLELVEVRTVTPYAAARHRHLHVYRKSSPTPGRFPRRPGVARKRSRNRARARKQRADPAPRRAPDRDRR